MTIIDPMCAAALTKEPRPIRDSAGSDPIGNPSQLDIHVVTLPFRFSHRFGLRLLTIPRSLFANYNVPKDGSLPE